MRTGAMGPRRGPRRRSTEGGPQPRRPPARFSRGVSIDLSSKRVPALSCCPGPFSKSIMLVFSRDLRYSISEYWSRSYLKNSPMDHLAILVRTSAFHPLTTSFRNGATRIHTSLSSHTTQVDVQHYPLIVHCPSSSCSRIGPSSVCHARFFHAMASRS